MRMYKNPLNSRDIAVDAAFEREVQEDSILRKFRTCAQFRLDCKVERGGNRSLLIWPPGVSRQSDPIILKRDLRLRERKGPAIPLPSRQQKTESPPPLLPVPLPRHATRKRRRKRRSPADQEQLLLVGWIGLIDSRKKNVTLKKAMNAAVANVKDPSVRDDRAKKLATLWRRRQRHRLCLKRQLSRASAE
jgi:hypothetical protein